MSVSGRSRPSYGTRCPLYVSLYVAGRYEQAEKGMKFYGEGIARAKKRKKREREREGDREIYVGTITCRGH